MILTKEKYITYVKDNNKIKYLTSDNLNNLEVVHTDTFDIRSLFKICEDYPKAKIFALINNKEIPIDWSGYIENEVLFMEANVNSVPMTGKNIAHYIELESEYECWYSIFGSLFLNCEYYIVNTHGNEDFEIENAGDNDFYKVTALKAVDNKIILVCENMYL